MCLAIRVIWAYCDYVSFIHNTHYSNLHICARITYNHGSKYYIYIREELQKRCTLSGKAIGWHFSVMYNTCTSLSFVNLSKPFQFVKGTLNEGNSWQVQFFKLWLVIVGFRSPRIDWLSICASISSNGVPSHEIDSSYLDKFHGT